MEHGREGSIGHYNPYPQYEKHAITEVLENKISQTQERCHAVRMYKQICKEAGEIMNVPAAGDNLQPPEVAKKQVFKRQRI